MLFRTNARSADYEEALSESGIPSQGAALLARDAAKQLLKALRGRPVSDVPKIAREQGLLEVIPDRLGEREVTRQNDLGRLVRLAADYGEGSAAEFVAYLEEHFGSHAGQGAAPPHVPPGQGPRVRGRVPSAPRGARASVEALEDRRRAGRGAATALRRPDASEASSHRHVVGQAEPLPGRAPDRRRAAPGPKPIEPDDPLYEVLKRWRLETAKQEERPAYVIFHNSTLAEIVRRAPRSREELAAVPGVGPAKLERYGDDVLAVLAAGT